MVPDMSLRASGPANSSVRTYLRLYGTPSLCAPCLAGAHGVRSNNNDNGARGRRSKKGSLSHKTALRGEPWKRRPRLEFFCCAVCALTPPPPRARYAVKHFGKKAVLHATFRGARSLGYRLFPQRVHFVQRAVRVHAAGLGFLSD